MATTTTKPGAKASVRYLHVSAYKVRQVLELIRGLPVDDAERILQLCEKDAANHMQKLLNSATANAEHNHELPADELFVAAAWADEGPTRNWGQARARGRYFRIRKRTAHVTIVLERFETDELEERRRRDEVSGRGAAVAQRRRAERVRRSRAVQTDEEPQIEKASMVEEEVAAAEGDYVDVDEAIEEAEADAEADADAEAEPEVEEDK